MTTNHDQIGKALTVLRGGLYPYFEQHIQSASANQWLAKIQPSLPKDATLKRSIQETLKEDVGALLIVLSRQWDKVFKRQPSPVERALVSELIDVRNKWAHQSDFPTADTYRALDSIERLLNAVSAKPGAIAAITKQKQEVFQLLTSFSEKEVRIREKLQELLERLPFQNVLLLFQALTHRTYLYENPRTTEGENEQLEFLGDSVLEFLAGAYLYRRYPGWTEEELTNYRSSLIDNQRLAEFAKTLDLGKWMMLGRGEELSNGRNKPTLLSNVFEAVIGAYFLDSGIESVKSLVEPLFDSVKQLPDKVDPLGQAPMLGDPKGRFQQYAQANYQQLPEYIVIDENGPDHEKTRTVEVRISGQVYGVGTARGKRQEAEKQAAIDALRKLGL